MELNDSVTYKAFPESGTARVVDEMPLLIKEGRTPLSVSGLMNRRLEVKGRNNDVENNFWNNYFFTGDGIAYHPDGRVKVVLDSKNLREVTSDSVLSNGALVLPDGAYGSLNGVELTKKDFQGIVGKLLNRKEAKNNPFWQALSRDQNLLDKYVDAVFDIAKEKYQYTNNMGIWLAEPRDVPVLRPWVVGSLDNYYSLLLTATTASTTSAVAWLG